MANAQPQRGSVNVMNGTATHPECAPGSKLTIRVYTVSRAGIVSPPTVSIALPHGYQPQQERIGTELSPCACPTHRVTGGAR